MDSTVNLSFRYLESDFVQAMRAHYASRLRLRLDIAVVIATAAVGAYLWHSPDSHLFGMVAFGISAVFALMLIAAFTVIPYVVFRRDPKYRDDYSLTFSPEGIHFRTAHIDSQLQWSIYSRVLVDAHSFVLYWGSSYFTVIPKRVFQSVEQQELFEKLLAQNVSTIVRRGA
jgi:hypothetical protein